MSALVLRQDIDGVAVLTLNRPDKLNALNVALFQELYDHTKDIESRSDTIGCVVIRVLAGVSLPAMTWEILPLGKNCPDRIFRPKSSRP